MTNVLSSIRGAVANQVGILGGTTTYDVIGDLPLSGNEAGDQAFVIATNRLYLWSGAGWYNIAIINTTPTFSTGPDASYTLASDGVTTTVISLLATDPEGFAVTYSVVADSDFNGLATVSQDSSVFTITPKSEANATTSTGTLTFKATDGVNIASEISTFTLSFGPDWSATPTETILRASDAQASDTYGRQAIISSDGNYAIVGAYGEDGGGGDPLTSAGAAYVFVRSGSTWTQQAKLTASDAEAGASFGWAVSISSDGTYAIAGAYLANYGGNSAGAAYVFTRSGSTWTQQAKLVASDIQAGDQFGISADISGDGNYAIIGARLEDTGGTDAGSAYIFTRSGSTWTEQQKIQSSDIQAGDYFGYSVSINSDATYAIVSAYREDTSATDAGAAYVFTRSGSTWTEQAKLTASDGQGSDQLGFSVSINGDGSYVIVGANNEDGGAGDPLSNSGAAYVFTRSGSTWTEQAILRASDAAASDGQGWSVSMSSDGTHAVVGSWLADPVYSDAGAAYIFSRSGSTWTEVKKLTASDPGTDDRFGWSVSINSDGSYALIGAPREDGGTGDPITRAGAAYIYEAG